MIHGKYRLFLKIASIVFVLALTVYIGVSFVAPRIILKMTRHVSRSTAADYGMRYDQKIVVSEDSLDLMGDMIFPFNLEYGQKHGNHSLIVLHEITGNTRSIYSSVKSLITLDINFLTFDSRGHGRSDGFMYTMGLKESDDISKIIDTMLEENPDHSFGIYAKGNSANVALKAMEKDKRIRYGIVENYFPTLEDHLLYMNYDDLIYSQKYLNKYILKNTLDYLDTSIDEVSIHPDRINQPILMLSTPYNYEAMSVLHDTVNSADKYLMLFEENILLKTGYKGADEGLLNCLTEFIEMYSNEAKEYIHDEIFQPS